MPLAAKQSITDIPMVEAKRDAETSAPKTSAFSSVYLRDVLAGAGGGVVCTLVCSPLDVAKTRLQVQGFLGLHKYHGLRGTLSTIWREEGLRGLYRGLEPSLLTIPLFWAIYFPIYDGIKAKLKEWHPASSLLHPTLGAVGAAVVADVVSNPFWVVRTRMMTDIYHGNQVEKMHTFAIIRSIFEREGFAGMYKGLGASLLGLSHVAIQFPIYEKLKTMAKDRRGSTDLTAADLITASAVSKLVASSLTYPHEVVRSRMQDCRGKEGFGLLEIMVTIWRHEGVRGFYQGIGVNLARVLPACISTFVSFELIKKKLASLAPAAQHA